MQPTSYHMENAWLRSVVADNKVALSKAYATISSQRETINELRRQLIVSETALRDLASKLQLMEKNNASHHST